MTSRERYLQRRCARLNQLCAAGRQTVRRVPPSGYDVTIYRGPLDERSTSSSKPTGAPAAA